jgi:2-methylisocitrate lyase-like PEP mutase family enzyme
MSVIQMTTGRNDSIRGMDLLQRKAETLRALHRCGRILVLPNAWDAASAKVFEKAGFPAIATTSAGIAATMGYADGQRIPRQLMLDTVARIASAVDIPVTADLEAGFATTPEEMRETTERLLETGAVGLNLEDGLREGPLPMVQTSHHVAKIKVVREVCRVAGVDLVINARTDIYLKCVGETANRFSHTVHRGNNYLAAGADCVFIPGVVEAETIGELATQIQGPINVLAVSGTPRIAELQRLGVARVSFGSAPMRAALSLIEKFAQELRDYGTFDSVTTQAMPYAKANALFADNSER